MARWVARRMFSWSISRADAEATAQVQDGVALMTSASASRRFSESFFESLMAAQGPVRRSAAASSGTETAVANTGPASGPRPASSMPITVEPEGRARSKSRETAFISTAGR